MTQDNNNMGAGLHNEPEPIDLIDLVLQLWRGKVTIITCVVIAILLAVAYLSVAREKWTSTAIVTQPDVGQIAEYSNALNVMYGEDAPKSMDIQQAIIERFNASFSALAESLDNQTVPEKLTINAAVKGQPLPLKVTYSGKSAEDAQQTLANYIQQVDDDVAKGLDADLVSSITSRESELQKSLTSQEKVAVEQKALRLAQINQALTVAQQSNIKQPQVLQADHVSQDTMFMLGSDALSAMVKNEATRPLTFPESYYQTRQSLIEVTNLMAEVKNHGDKKNRVHAFRYIMKPSLPVRRDSPKRGLTIILAVLLGGLVGTGIVLGRNALRRYNAKA